MLEDEWWARTRAATDLEDVAHDGWPLAWDTSRRRFGARRENDIAVASTCPLTVAEYASAGRAVTVPRPDCPSCGRPMTFEGSHPRLVRIFPTSPVTDLHPPARLRRLREGPRPAPRFRSPGPPGPRRGHRGRPGGGGGPLPGERTPSPADGVAASTRRSWRRCFASRSEVLAAGFRALVVTYDGELPRSLDLPAGPPALVAVVSLGAAWDASRRRCARAGKAIVAPWRFANLVCGSALVATRVNLRWEVLAMANTTPHRRALPP